MTKWNDRKETNYTVSATASKTPKGTDDGAASHNTLRLLNSTLLPDPAHTAASLRLMSQVNHSLAKTNKLIDERVCRSSALSSGSVFKRFPDCFLNAKCFFSSSSSPHTNIADLVWKMIQFLSRVIPKLIIRTTDRCGESILSFSPHINFWPSLWKVAAETETRPTRRQFPDHLLSSSFCVFCFGLFAASVSSSTALQERYKLGLD